ncbi:hypothetical protein IMCC3317_38810 [Kordia antarctica]|uniref:Outer membrane protein beta-barrel domain-containing protein n=1 Tax=Kordia antarctica TaxID=1218801 RepID=A0A7L4ZP19_9FLAO|nr:hypothetical protein [Kordia antarctica]QHI38488.1 hypothetical protein IMCC3317_38810 [Kordia antarctica]
MKIFKFLSVLIFISCASCGVDRVYTSASYGDLKSHTAKPEYQGKQEKALYVSAAYSKGKHNQLGNAEQYNDKKSIISANIHKSVTGKYYNYYYGIGGAFGNYTFIKGLDENVQDNERKNFFNVNSKVGINYTWTRKKFDFRFIGLEVAYHYEFGSYQDKLKELEEEYKDNSAILIFKEESMFSWNLYSEVVYKINKNNALEFGIFAGAIFLSPRERVNNRSSFVGYTLAYRYKRFTGSFVFSSASAADPIRGSRYGLTYRLD